MYKGREEGEILSEGWSQAGGNSSSGNNNTSHWFLSAYNVIKLSLCINSFNPYYNLVEKIFLFSFGDEDAKAQRQIS